MLTQKQGLAEIPPTRGHRDMPMEPQSCHLPLRPMYRDTGGAEPLFAALLLAIASMLSARASASLPLCQWRLVSVRSACPDWLCS